MELPVYGGFAAFPNIESVALQGDCPEFELSLTTGDPPRRMKYLQLRKMWPLGHDLDMDRAPSPDNASSNAVMPLTMLDMMNAFHPSVNVFHDDPIGSFQRFLVRKAAMVASTTGIKVRIFQETKSNQATVPSLHGDQDSYMDLVHVGCKFVDIHDVEDRSI